MKVNAAFFGDLIKQGSMAVLAVAVSRGEVTMDELYQRMTESEQEKLDRQVELLEKLRNDNSRDEGQEYEIAKSLMHKVASEVLGVPAPA